MLQIEVGKTYLSRDGGKTRIVVDNIKTSHKEYHYLGLWTSPNTHTEHCVLYNVHGVILGDSIYGNLIRESTPWEKFKVDEPVRVDVGGGTPLIKRHFAYIKDGKPYCWDDGKTSFTTREASPWDVCERET